MKRALAFLLLFAAMLIETGWMPSFVVPSPFSQRVDLVGAWFIIIEESSTRPMSLAKIDSDMGLREELKVLGIRYLRMDKDSPDAAPYVGRTGELPAYLLVNGDGTVISEGKMPDTRELVLSIARQK